MYYPQIIRYLPFKSHTEILAPALLEKPQIPFMVVSKDDEADLQGVIPVELMFYAKAFFACPDFG